MADDQYPDNFWPTLITLVAAGAFIYWVMTTPDSVEIFKKYLYYPILKVLNKVTGSF